MYLGQKRFQDVYDLLDSAGFEFVRFQSIGETSDSAPLGFRSTGYQGQADALFLRRSERIPLDDPSRREVLTKLCFFALVFDVVELAVQCLTALNGKTLPRTGAYERFVAACRDIYQRDAKLFPPVFSAVLPPHRMADYSAAATPQEWPGIFEGLRRLDIAYLRKLKRYDTRADSEFEALLRRYGLAGVAASVKRTRRNQVRNIRWAILSAHGRAPRLREMLKQSGKALRRAIPGA
jgi:hypothetical protein